MKNLILAANWKSNKTVHESTEWLHNFSALLEQHRLNTSCAKIIIAAPYTDLYALKNNTEAFKLPIEIGAQDLSPFAEGAYTGQISARMVKEIAQWVIIGHSERRRYFKETDTSLLEKTVEAKKNGLKIIYCISDISMPVPREVDVVAYEPLWAIGTGKSDTPENANQTVAAIKEKTTIPLALYGGSVAADNVSLLVHTQAIDGVLVGGASLDPDKFFHLIENAITEK